MVANRNPLKQASNPIYYPQGGGSADPSFVGPAPSPGGNLGLGLGFNRASTPLGMLGTGLGMATGVPGLGLLGSGIGTGIDMSRAKGSFPQTSPSFLSGLGHALTMGLLGEGPVTQSIGQYRQRTGSTLNTPALRAAVNKRTYSGPKGVAKRGGGSAQAGRGFGGGEGYGPGGRHGATGSARGGGSERF